jgi:chaperonin GroEL (HSP60 family)
LVSRLHRKYAKVEKIPGGDIQDSRVLRGVMFEKDVVVPARMRRCAGPAALPIVATATASLAAARLAQLEVH